MVQEAWGLVSAEPYHNPILPHTALPTLLKALHVPPSPSNLRQWQIDSFVIVSGKRVFLLGASATWG